MAKYIPIVFIADESYIVPTSVAIQSIIENKNDSTAYKFYILTSELSPKSIDNLNEFKSDKVDIRVVTSSIEKYNNIHHGVENSYCQATETALLKFDIPELVDENRIIYLDGDILCLCDLSDLYATDLEGHCLGAVMDSGKMYSGREFVLNTPTYFNSGVMIMELKLMKENNVGQKLYDIKKEMIDSQLMDQDVFNTLFINKVKMLPIRYNFLYINLLRAKHQNKFEINNLNDLYGTNYTSLSSALDDAAIVHFASKNKPWKDIDVELHDVWKGYFDRSPVSGETDYLLRHQNAWLYSEYHSLSKELSRTKKKVKELSRKDSAYWKRECQNIQNSISFKIGRLITAVPRFFRDKLRTLKADRTRKDKYKQWLPIVSDGLNTENRPNKIIISLTSYGPRLKTAHITVGTLLRQTIKPDKIVLCIAEADYKNLTPELKKLEKHGLIEVLKCEDLKSPHMKYFFTMQKYPDDIVITVDDDVIYRLDLIEKLYAAYKLFPECVSALRVHRIRLNEEGNIRPYSKWKMRSSEYILIPRNDYFATGVGGVLYPPHILHSDLFRLDIIKETCLKADDVWLKFMELLNNVKVVLADSYKTLEYIENTQQIGLYNNNVDSNQNDVQIEMVLNHYGKTKCIEMINNN